MADEPDHPWGQRGGRINLPYPRDANGKPLCRWCEKPVAPPRVSWCSKKCVDEYLARSQWPVMRDRIIARDVVCQVCGSIAWDKRLGAVLRIRIAYQGDELSGWAIESTNWREGAQRRRRVLNVEELVEGAFCRVEPMWEVDHIIAVNDGGTDEPSNLRLLCVPCHKLVTADQRARWALARQPNSDLFDDI